jgi:hypothetical protein
MSIIDKHSIYNDLQDSSNEGITTNNMQQPPESQSVQTKIMKGFPAVLVLQPFTFHSSYIVLRVGTSLCWYWDY